MSDNVIISLIGGAFLLLNTVLTALILMLKNRVEKYHHEVNNMKDQLVEAVKGKGEAEGFIKGLEKTAENKAAK